MKHAFIYLALSLSLSSCEYLQKQVDLSGIEDMKEKIFADFDTGNPKSLKHFVDSLNLDKNSKPLFADKINTRDRQKWTLSSKMGDSLIEETLTFPSLLLKYIPKDSATFFVYRISEFKGSKTILWIPGFGVSDKAFYFIKKIFLAELKRGYNLVVYIPPYHLGRKLPDKENGDGFFTADMQKNLIVNFEELREIRTICRYLKNQGVKEISAWAGSMGASTLLLSTKFVKYEHICLMIPVVDWNDIIFNNRHFAPIADSLIAHGFKRTDISNALKKMSPLNYALDLPKNTFVQYAKYDQLNGQNSIHKFIVEYGLDNVKSYKTSHATILLSPSLYEDYGMFLDSIQISILR